MNSTRETRTKDYLKKKVDGLLVLRKTLSREKRRLLKYKDINLKKNGKYYTKYKRTGGKEIQEYAGKVDKSILDISAYHYIEKALEVIDHEVEHCRWQIENGAGVRPEILLEYLPKAYQEQPEYIYAITGSEKLHDWLTKEWEFNEKYPEAKVFKTKAGWIVRSKSEVMIADHLTELSIPYVYEAIKYFNGIAFAPDFILFSTRKNCEIIWEHFGRMNDPEYALHCIQKIKTYLEEGYILGHNLIVTVEYGNEGFDSAIIQKIIDSYF